MSGYTIGEVCTLLELKPHVVRYWENELPLLQPTKDRGGRRRYRDRDVELLWRMKHLIERRGYTIAGAGRRLVEESAAPRTELLHAAHRVRGQLLKLRREATELRARLDKAVGFPDVLASRPDAEELAEAWRGLSPAGRSKLVPELAAYPGWWCTTLAALHRKRASEEPLASVPVSNVPAGAASTGARVLEVYFDLQPRVFRRLVKEGRRALFLCDRRTYAQVEEETDCVRLAWSPPQPGFDRSGRLHIAETGRIFGRRSPFSDAFLRLMCPDLLPLVLRADVVALSRGAPVDPTLVRAHRYVGASASCRGVPEEDGRFGLRGPVYVDPAFLRRCSAGGVLPKTTAGEAYVIDAVRPTVLRMAANPRLFVTDGSSPEA